MIIFGIDTSCDETSAALVEAKNGNFRILSNIVFSQINVHKKYGGVVPEVAAREHIKKIIPVLEQTFKNFSKKTVDLIAVTNGPGLITSLLVGIETAKTLSYFLKKSLVSVNHLVGHIYANFFNKHLSAKIFPAICLIVSGGHTELVLMTNYEKFKKIGQTLDDAAGECFDKSAKLLGLGYPGGPEISKCASKLSITNYNSLKFYFPRPMINSKNYNFSFSGLKTAVLYRIKKMNKKQIKENLPIICFEIQQAIIDVLVKKTMRAAREYNARSIILGGGVIANKKLREKFSAQCRQINLPLFFPPKNLCTDNAAMISVAGYFKYINSKNRKKFKENWRNMKVNPNLDI
ncbi:tRNA (adenosine(37)-N6)-threonylcarbamoyltransferase complex transferase subunit TsaD [bacterium]|nr:tRNA (adenosine(37)-N6)-threonylcarbamoyltransferase complex transferase subunit TsaD [bacterium]